MKNMFKMMGVALLAGAMLFTACKKEEKTETAATTYAVTVNYGGQTWHNNDNMTYSIAGNLMTIQAEEGDVMLQVVSGKEKKTYSFGESSDYGVVLVSGEGQINGNVNGVMVISDINLNATPATISATVSCEMGEVGSGDMMTATFDNAKMDLGEK